MWTVAYNAAQTINVKSVFLDLYQSMETASIKNVEYKIVWTVKVTLLVLNAMMGTSMLMIFVN